MGKDLIIVESPAKVKTIKKFLGSKYTVQASVGHIRDLPSGKLSVDENNGFAPHYETIPGKEKVVAGLREEAAKADTVYLAPDPDREGEAIAWHIAQAIQDKAKNVKRIQFNEITAKAVREALLHPREIDVNLFDAQQARRVLDRLVGYKISPLLWKTVKRGISAGRVQSVALRLIVEREEKRLAFVPEEYWNFRAELEGDVPPPFHADLFQLERSFAKKLREMRKEKEGDKKILISCKEAADFLEAAMGGQAFIVDSVEEKERSKNPLPPYTTSTLQQSANQRLSFPAKRTMATAQRLYEGVDLGERGTTALITYMRTDSVRIADEARKAAVDYIAERFGPDYQAAGGKGRVFKGKSNAQDAHEAIRPVDVRLTPQDVKPFLTPEQYRLYTLIWNRFVASQMAAARCHDTVVLISCGPSLWKAKGVRILFAGFMEIMPGMEEENALPPLKKGDEVKCLKMEKEQKFTQPSPRYTEAALVKELEELGIGRPSTYATIISTIQDREYVRLEEKHFVPTDLGRVVCSQLRENFPHLMDVGFTAEMEGNLDKVAEGGLGWVELMTEFTADFNPTLETAAKNMKTMKSGLETDIPCPKCGKPMKIKFGKSGEFLACSGYPECRHSADFTRDDKGVIQLVEHVKEELPKVGVCPKCGGDVVLRKSRLGARFLSCARYPDCDYAASWSTGVPCPKCGKGEMVEKCSKKGKIFYSCGRYPECEFALWDFPVAKACPKCGFPVLVRKVSRAGGARLSCPQTGCRFSEKENKEAD